MTLMKDSTHIDIEKAMQIVKIVVESYESREGLFSVIADPEEFSIPPGVERGSKEHALFIMHNLPVHHQIKLVKFLQKACRFYLSKSEFYDPYWISTNFSPDELDRLAEVLGEELGVRFPKECARRWFEVSKKLVERFEGDPRKIFTYHNFDVESILKEVGQWRGFGLNTRNLFIRLFREYCFIEAKKLEKLEKLEMPVDINDVKVTLRTGVVKLLGEDLVSENGLKPRDKIIKLVQKAWKEACTKVDIHLLEFDRAFWSLGSIYCTERICIQCPIHNCCDLFVRGSATTVGGEKS